MTLEDPYFVVKDEVCKALTKMRELFDRWQDLQEYEASGERSVPTTPSPCLGGGLSVILNTQEELEWTKTELRNAIRSIEWDLEDLDDTIHILEKNPNKFKVDNKELTVRRLFIEQTREEVKIMKDKMNISKGRDRDRTARQPLRDNSPVKDTPVPTSSHGSARYSKLENEMDSPNRQFIQNPICNQNSMRRYPDELEIINDNTDILKTVSRQFNFECDERMLDDFGNEMEIINDSKLDATMKKMAKVLHMNNDRSRWVAIGILTGTLFIIIVILCVL